MPDTVYIYWKRGETLKLWRVVRPHDDPVCKFCLENGSDPFFAPLPGSDLKEALEFVVRSMLDWSFIAQGDCGQYIFSAEELS